ncbi:homocysteine S-methyltransferase family protein [Patescibacteria group bacterium]
MAAPAMIEIETLQNAVGIEPPAVYDGSKGSLFNDLVANDGWKPQIENIPDEYKEFRQSLESNGYKHLSDVLNFTNPEHVLAVTKEYIEAGSQLVQTNTFNANADSLSAAYEGVTSELVLDLNKQAARLARQAVEESEKKIVVVGDVGPLVHFAKDGKLVKFPDALTHDEMKEFFAPQIQGLIEGGVDCIHIETMTQLGMVKAAVETVREINPDIPIMVTMTFEAQPDSSYKTNTGVAVNTFVDYCIENGISIFGANCGEGMDGAVGLMQEFTNAVDEKTPNHHPTLISKLNLGIDPSDLKDTDIENYTRNVYQAGAGIIGLCCGSTPRDIEVVASTLSDISSSVN